jgi:Raf kinase inhibitor-like YbhB/YbcL family protein
MQKNVMRSMFVLFGAAATAVTITAQAPQGAPPAAPAAPRTPPLIMTSTAWEDGGVFPDKYTGAAPGGMAVSPELKWTQAPPGTQSFTLLFHDPEGLQDRSTKMDVTHWLMWNIPATATGLPEGVAQGDLPDGSHQISRRLNGYMGPGAPAGPYHHYTFELYALDTKIDVPQGTPAQAAETRTAVMNAMDGHVLSRAILIARFHR